MDASGSADEIAIIALIGSWYRAIQTYDLVAVKAALTPEFLIIEHDLILTGDELVSRMAGGQEHGYQTAELSDMRLRVVGDVAWLTARNDEVWHSTSGARVSLEFLETVVLCRLDGRWKFDRYHATRLEARALE